MNDAWRVIDNRNESRFELATDGAEPGTPEAGSALPDGAVAELRYRRRADRLVLVHTEVPEALEGHGIGGLLVRAAVDRAAREGLTVVPLCPFARDWLERHPQEASDVSVDWGPPPDD
jgi:predicted GNAT family acetyltransferase